MKSRNETISELKLELSWRRKVYRNIPGQSENFIESKQQNRYDILKNLKETIESMTDAEFNKYQDRAERRKAERDRKPNTIF